MDRRKFLKAGGSTVGIGFFAGCLGGSSDESGNGGGQDGDGGEGQITIGAIEPLSGSFTAWGQDHRLGFEFGVQEINEDGGVLGGRKIQTVIQDTGSDPAKADSIFRRFVEQEGAVAVTGPVSSDVGIRTARTAQDLETPLYLHMAGSSEVITPETTYTFRVGLLPAPTTMRAQAQLVAEKEYKKIGAICADYAWGQSTKRSIKEYFPGDVQIEIAPLGAGDFKSYIRQFDRDIDMMIATGHPPGSLTITKQMYQLGYQPKLITGPGIPPGVSYQALGKDVTEGFTHFHNSDVYAEEYVDVGKRFANATDKRFGTHVSYGYVTAKLIAAAIEDAGDADPTAIRNATRDITFDTLFPKPIQYSDHGELKGQVQLYSQFELEPPLFYPKGKWKLTELFRTDPLPALPAEK
jgi:branched-chain amino acid transport system substrate-binding protein